MPAPPAFLSPLFLRLPRPPRQSLPRPAPACSSNSPPRAPLSMDNINFWWRHGRPALQDISLAVHPGELCMVVGENGSGKSTLLRVLRGLLIPSTGTVHVDSPCSFVFQNPNIQIVFPTIGADIAASVSRDEHTTDADVRRAVLEALEEVGLVPAEDFLRQGAQRMSGGQKQRAVMAAALVTKPKTILFDEVTASMDALNKAELVERVRRIVTERRIAALWVTHLLDELDLADSIIIMKRGRIFAQGPRVLMMPLVYQLQDGEL